MKKTMPILIPIVCGVLAGLLLSSLFIHQLQPEPIQAQTNPTDPTLPYSISESLPSTPLSEESSFSDVLSLMAHSNQTWQGLELAYQATFASDDPNQTDQVYTHEFWLGEGNQARLEISNEEGTLIQTWISNGSQTMTLDYENETYTTLGAPGAALAAETGQIDSFDPRSLAMPSGLNEFIFPMSLVSSLNREKIGENSVQKLTLLGIERVLDRPAILVDRLIAASDDPKMISKHHQYWVDAETGVILRVAVLNPQSGEAGQFFEVTQFELNPVFSAETFALKPEGGFEQKDTLQP
ncbi:MAG: hypothetical protein WA110_05280 [Anaerolineaceae bacterium]